MSSKTPVSGEWMARLLYVAPHNTKETFFTINAYRVLMMDSLKMGVLPLSLTRLKARRSAIGPVTSLLSEDGLLIYMGHGTPNGLRGSSIIWTDETDMVHIGVNEKVLAQKPWIVCTIACDALDPLGQAVVAQGARAFMGSREPIEVSLSSMDANHIPDVIETFVVLGRSLLGGKSVSESVQAFKRSSAQFADMCASSNDCTNPYFRKMMEVNQHYDYVGDGTARWSPKPPPTGG